MIGYRAKHFLWSVDNGVGSIVLNRPERKNPLTFESYAELRDLFQALASDGSVKAVVIAGAGGNFSSGGDVHEIIGPLTRLGSADILKFTQMTGDLVKAMRACPQPVIAAIEGACAGAGAILAMASDLRFGTRESRIAFLFVRVGLGGCDMGACSILPRIVGQGRAAELLYTGRALSGDEALAWGFLNRLCEKSVLMAEASALARELATGPAMAHAMTKKMLHREWSMDIDSSIDAEAIAQAQLMETQDFRRAYEAFVAKRSPQFEGN
jgi:enoyl-CoA hydratase/carnithine racemase